MREMRAAELMTPDPVVIERGTPINRAARELREHDIGSLPVVESMRDKRLVGMITDRDIAVRCVAADHDPSVCTAERHMTTSIVSTQAGDDVEHVMKLMRGARVRRVPVLDARGRVLGIIAQADLAVEAVEDQAVSGLEVAHTLQRISEPAHPERKTARGSRA